MPDFDLSWKETILAILDAYTTRTNGAEIQDKGSSLVWKFDDVDPEFASMQVKELHQHLAQVLATDGRSSSPAQTLSLRPPPLPPPLSLSLPSHPPLPPSLPTSAFTLLFLLRPPPRLRLMQVLDQWPQLELALGKGYLEIRPRGINKGVILDHIMEQLHANTGGVDFVLCVGDDSADEYMFSALQARYPNAGREAVGPAGGPSVFTTVVGRKPSSANYFLDDSDEVTELCQSLRLHSTRANRNRSMGDLQRLHTHLAAAGWGRARRTIGRHARLVARAGADTVRGPVGGAAAVGV